MAVAHAVSLRSASLSTYQVVHPQSGDVLPFSDDTLESYLALLHEQLEIPLGYAEHRSLPVVGEIDELIPLARLGERKTPVDKMIFASEETVDAWRELELAAKRDRIKLIPIAGFRGYEDQVALILQELKRGFDIEDVLSRVAAPGYSQHHSGRAIDFDTQEFSIFRKGFEDTKAFRWLEKNANDFGFFLSYPENNPHGFIFQPWHWYYRGMDNTTDY